MRDPLFGPEIRDMLDNRDAAGLKALCETLHPATLAEVVAEDFSAEQIWTIIGESDVSTQAAIFEYLPAGVQQEMAAGTHRPQVAKLLGKMSHDDRVDLLRRLPQSVQDPLLRLMDEADRRDIKMLFEYGENTVGAIMTTDYAWVSPNVTAAEAVDQLRQQAPDRETIYYIYVQDETRQSLEPERGRVAPRALLGVTSLRDLILAPRHMLVRDLMETEIVTLRYTDHREAAAKLLARYDFIAVPVVDEQGRMLGIVTHDDALDVVTEEATEDMQRQAGVLPLGESYLTASYGRLWRNRAPWLAVLFVAQLGTFTVLAYFEDMIATAVVLTLFIPLCISVGGNSGSQASTLITRALALGEVKLTDWKRLLRREILMGLGLGLSLGVIAFLRGAMTGEKTRSGPQTQNEVARLLVPVDQPLTHNSDGELVVPKGTRIETITDKDMYIKVEGDIDNVNSNNMTGYREYLIPAGSEVRSDPVDRYALGIVIAIAVVFICLWGTLIGAMLPIFFKRLGWDPAVASGPFVATFVDISGIAIFCSLAKWILLS